MLAPIHNEKETSVNPSETNDNSEGERPDKAPPRSQVVTSKMGRTSGVILTNRQTKILRLLADGKSTDEIATSLSLSRATVRNHIANLIAALGVHSRLQAVVAASKAGLLDR